MIISEESKHSGSSGGSRDSSFRADKLVMRAISERDNDSEADESVLSRSKKSSKNLSLSKMNQNDFLCKPLIVACSSRIDDEVRQKCTDFGFDMVCEAPLEANAIHGMMRAVEIKRKQELLRKRIRSSKKSLSNLKKEV